MRNFSTQRKGGILKRGVSSFTQPLYTHIPLFRFSSMPFALFGGTSKSLCNLHIVRSRLLTSNQPLTLCSQLFRRSCFMVFLRQLLSSLRAENGRSRVADVKVFFGTKTFVCGVGEGALRPPPPHPQMFVWGRYGPLCPQGTAAYATLEVCNSAQLREVLSKCSRRVPATIK